MLGRAEPLREPRIRSLLMSALSEVEVVSENP